MVKGDWVLEHESDVGSYFRSLVSLPAHPQIPGQWATLEIWHHSWGRILKGAMTGPQWKRGWWGMGRWICGLRQLSLQRNIRLVDPRSKNQREWFGFGSASTVTAKWPGRPRKPAVSPSVVGKHVVHQYPWPIPPYLPTLSRTSAPPLPHCIYFMLPSVLTSKQSPTLSNLHSLNKSVPSTHLKPCGTQLWRNLSTLEILN